MVQIPSVWGHGALPVAGLRLHLQKHGHHAACLMLWAADHPLTCTNPRACDLGVFPCLQIMIAHEARTLAKA